MTGHHDHSKRSHAQRAAALQARQLTIPPIGGGGDTVASPGGGAAATPSPAPAASPSPPASPPPPVASPPGTTSSPPPPPPVVTIVSPSTTAPTITSSAPDRTTTITSTSLPPVVATVARTSTTTSSVVPPSTTSSLRTPSTVYNTILTRLSSSGTILAASTSAAPESDGPGAGTVVGAVAGALVGVVVLSGLIGYLFKAKYGKSKEERDDDDPFSRGNFRRESQMIPDDYDDTMSQISGGTSMGRSNTMQNLGRSDTSGSAGPRPPTFIQRHIYNTQPSPSFQPGQIIDPAYYGNTGFPRQSPVVGDAGGWGVAAGYHAQPAYGQQPPNGYTSSQAGSVYGDGLSRAGTVRSAYDQQDGYGHGGTLHGVREEDEELPSRSGTPVNPNPQSVYYHHASRTASTDQSSAGGATLGAASHLGRPAASGPPSTIRELAYDRARNRMSVRNGDEQDAYGGI